MHIIGEEELIDSTITLKLTLIACMISSLVGLLAVGLYNIKL